MRLKIKIVDKSCPGPRYATEGSVGFDLASRETVVVPPKGYALIPLNVIVKVPKGYALLIFPRSSLFIKKRLLVANSVGVIDEDYCGPDDEVKLIVFNPFDVEITVKKGEYIAQGILVRIERANLVEVEDLGCKNRGGFGSTGGLSHV
ncbi:MAG: dUTP diphosphatase [Thermoplasmata archaeon]|nr:dUTP diphosphatase [Euryarchaeota archaeon]RLF64200.1 MAG: dUTP diphosphatase [Thermoplasmata archaeon]